jgi:cation diffusion facilitator CzcD-associated flavoprotein CzcO
MRRSCHDPTVKSLHVDVLVIGAGLSGIDLACRMTTMVPDHTFAILESREASGGTWDLFRYPGIRSDSDMYTLSFPFRPWTHPRSIADGDSILTYLRDTVADYGIEDRIHYGQRVISASWSSTTQQWSVRAETEDGLVEHTASFVYLATGYYDYDSGHVVDFPGRGDFAGEVVHPQFWPQDLDVNGKRIVVIGSGATAVTLVPALVEQGAAHVTMLQRSPTWMISLPGSDVVAKAAFGLLPPRVAHRVIRAKNVGFNIGSYQFARRFPKVAAAVLTKGMQRALPTGYAVQPHFAPRYAPWDQRLCVVPDDDLFAAVSSGRADIVTDTVERIEPHGIRTTGGEALDADVIVTATGLRMTAAGKIHLDVDGEPVRINEGYVYKGLMLSDVPNLAWCVGYINNSWTLRADLSAKWTCRLLKHLRDSDLGTATPRYDPGPDADREGTPIIDMSSGYIQRAADTLPRRGTRRPWVLKQNYVLDLLSMSTRRFDDGHLEFARSRTRALTPQ